MKVLWIILSALSGIGNLVKCYEFLRGTNMKIDIAWLFLFAIFIFSIGYLLYGLYRQYKRLLEWINFPSDHISKYHNLAEMIQQIADSRLGK